MTTKILIILTLAIAPLVSLASGAPHNTEGIPKVVFWQAINLILLALILIYYTKNKIIALFDQRQKTFLVAAEKSKKLHAEAEKNFLDVKHKLDLLSSYTEENIARIRAEAADLKKMMISDAIESAKRIKADTQASIQVEAIKAERAVRSKAVQEAMTVARAVLTKDLSTQDHQRLQGDFLTGINEVHP